MVRIQHAGRNYRTKTWGTPAEKRNTGRARKPRKVKISVHSGACGPLIFRETGKILRTVPHCGAERGINFYFAPPHVPSGAPDFRGPVFVGSGTSCSPLHNSSFRRQVFCRAPSRAPLLRTAFAHSMRISGISEAFNMRQMVDLHSLSLSAVYEALNIHQVAKRVHIYHPAYVKSLKYAGSLCFRCDIVR